MTDFFDQYERIFSYLKSRSQEPAIVNAAKFEKVLEMLSDDASRDTWLRDMLYVCTRDYLKGELPHSLAGLLSRADWNRAQEQVAQNNLHPELKCNDSHDSKYVRIYCITATFIQKQYQYADLVKVEKGDVCLDVGGCLGDASIFFSECGAKEVHTFEIDKDNISLMQATFSEIPGGITIHQVAAADRSSLCWYAKHPTNIGGGRIFNDQTQAQNFSKIVYPAEFVRLADYCKEHWIKPDFIKMDIEGGEQGALRGAAEMLAELRPKLAISIYHSFEDRYAIPIYLHELLPDYNFYVKKAHFEYETILFGKSKYEKSNRAAN